MDEATSMKSPQRLGKANSDPENLHDRQVFRSGQKIYRLTSDVFQHHGALTVVFLPSVRLYHSINFKTCEEIELLLEQDDLFAAGTVVALGLQNNGLVLATSGGSEIPLFGYSHATSQLIDNLQISVACASSCRTRNCCVVRKWFLKDGLALAPRCNRHLVYPSLCSSTRHGISSASADKT